MMRGSRISDRSVIGLLVVGLGIMFLLDTTNVLGPGARILRTHWPALLIAWAVWRINARNPMPATISSPANLQSPDRFFAKGIEVKD